MKQNSREDRVRCWFEILFAIPLLFGDARTQCSARADEPAAVGTNAIHRTTPQWVSETPIVIVGNWDSAAIFRRRKGGNPLWADEQYARAHTEEAVVRLKEFGVTLAILHFYKGFGLEAEKDQLEDTKALAALCKKHGIRVGVYVGSTICYETFLVEMPAAEAWLVPNYRGERVRYPGTQTYRRQPYFMHPGFVDYMKRVVRIAIEEFGADLIHFDNTSLRGRRSVFHHPLAIEHFRQFLRESLTPEERVGRFGFSNVTHVEPPVFEEHLNVIDDPIFQAWTEFRCHQIVKFYKEMDRFIFELNPEVAIDNNPASGLSGINTMWEQGVDYPRLLAHTDFVWTEEGTGVGFPDDGPLQSRIRSYKQATGLSNGIFTYTSDELLKMAESLAFNRRCVGMVGGMLAGFEHREVGGDRVLDDPYTWGRGADDPETMRRKRAYIDFFRKNFAAYREAQSIANVAVLRSFATMAYSNARPQQSTYLFEQALIEAHVPFDIVFDKDIADLSRYRVLVLADQEALSNEQLEQIRKFVHSGGGLVATEHTSLYTEHRRRRGDFGLADLFSVSAAPWPGYGSTPETILSRPPSRREIGRGRVVYLPEVIPSIKRSVGAPMVGRYWKLPRNAAELIASVRWAAADDLPLEVNAPRGTVAELVSIRDPDGLALHLVNYAAKQQPLVENIAVRLKLPSERRVRKITLHSPDTDENQDLPFRLVQKQIHFTVPQLNVYDLVLVYYE